MMQPNVALPVKNSSTLSRVADEGSNVMLVMIDPDAPTPDNPSASQILHWLATDLSAKTAAQDFGALQGQAVLSGSGQADVVPFAPPGPPATSAAHRYLLFLFAQPDNFAVPAQFSQFNAQSRTGFDLNAFVAAAQLPAPLAVNFMYVSGQDVVPLDFQGAPFSQFPGGNGNAIGLPGSTAGTASASNGTVPIAAPPAASGAAGAGAGGLITGSAGQTMTGMGTLGADGACTCNVACPAGSFPNVMVSG